jgi:hypothetical protein
MKKFPINKNLKQPWVQSGLYRIMKQDLPMALYAVAFSKASPTLKPSLCPGL